MTDLPSYLPKDWDDDMKMTVMFSPFRDRHLNPKSWEQKMKFWSETIQEYSLQQKEAIISVASLREKFRRKGKSPSCLDTVMQEMIGKGQLKKLSDIENCATGSWLSWGYSAFVKKPIGWSLKWLSRQPEETVDESFVVLEVIKEKAQQLLEIRGRLEQTNSINIVEYDHLHEEHRDLCPTDAEFTLVMQELVDTKEVVIQKGDDNTKLVKFLHIKDKKKKTDKINEQDIHLHRIQKAHTEVKKQIEILSTEVQRLGTEAVSLKQKGMAKQAISCMRKRKLAQMRIDKLTGSMDTLEEILFRIKQAESNEMIIKAIEGGTSVLRDMTSKTTADDVANVMDNLADVTQTQEDIMSELNATVCIDEPSQAELEEELSDILNESLTKPEPKSAKVTRALDGDEDLNLEHELQEILNESVEYDSTKGLTEMLDDLQLPDVPTHSPVTHRVTDRQLLTS